MHAGDAAVEIGDGGDHGRPSLGRRVLVRPIITARVEPQRVGVVDRLDAAIAQVHLDQRAAGWPRQSEEPPRQLGSVARHHATLPNVPRLCCAGAVDRPRNNAQSPGRNITLGATYSI